MTLAANKSRLNLSLKKANIEWLRQEAGSERKLGEYIDNMIERIRDKHSEVERLEQVLRRLEHISNIALYPNT
jgi:hypothetical protein